MKVLSKAFRISLASALCWFWGIVMVLFACQKFLGVATLLRAISPDLNFIPSRLSFVFFYPTLDILFGSLFVWCGLELSSRRAEAGSRTLLTAAFFLILYLVTGINTLDRFADLGLCVVSAIIVLVLFTPFDSPPTP
jgi:hypothetical protein